MYFDQVQENKLGNLLTNVSGDDNDDDDDDDDDDDVT